jgi:Uncharacterised nucleotidyltransferase
MSSSQTERQLILLSAGTSARRQAMREHAMRLTMEVDWSRLAQMLRPRKLLAVLGPRILALAEEHANGDFAAAVREALETGRRQSAFLQMVSLRVTAMLAEAGVRSTVLKGPLLSEALYGDPGRRLSSDIDVLVSPGQLHRAVEVVRALGYEDPTDYIQGCGLPVLHFVLIHEREALPPVELHWRVHWYERSFARERLLAPAGNSSADWRPAPADELAALLLFYARDGFIDLRLATDLSAWWDVYGADLPSSALDELLGVYPGLARVIPVAVNVAEKIVGLPAAQIIDDRHKLDLRGRAAARLANPNPHTSQSQLYADMGLVDGLLAPAGGFSAFVRRQLLPPSAILEKQARHGAKRRPRSPLVRCVSMLGRYARTMTRLVHRPETLT